MELYFHTTQVLLQQQPEVHLGVGITLMIVLSKVMAHLPGIRNKKRYKLCSVYASVGFRYTLLNCDTRLIRSNDCFGVPHELV